MISEYRERKKGKRRNLPAGLLLGPCFCIVTCALRWFNVPYAFVQFGKLEFKQKQNKAKPSVRSIPKTNR